ncbi:hypothetical protein A2U01_0044897, partial [Trifolium medium]|nr:hypothetical protein [Trifolium medium]
MAAKSGLDGGAISRALSTGISYVSCGHFPDWRSVKICTSSPSSDEGEFSRPSLGSDSGNVWSLSSTRERTVPCSDGGEAGTASWLTPSFSCCDELAMEF